MPNLGWNAEPGIAGSLWLVTNLFDLEVRNVGTPPNYEYEAVVWSVTPDSESRTWGRTVVGRYATEEEAKRAAVTAARKMLTDELDYYLPE
jgi:hypothetical protein